MCQPPAVYSLLVPVRLNHDDGGRGLDTGRTEHTAAVHAAAPAAAAPHRRRTKANYGRRRV